MKELNKKSKFYNSLCDSHKELYEALCVIEEDPSKKVRSDKLEADEYICYNQEKQQFECETGAPLAKEPIELIKKFNYISWFKWTFDAKWYVC